MSNGNETGTPLRAGDPRELDGYRIVSRLGRGGMGTVYLAEDASGTHVAVKLIHPALADDAAFRRRFAREVDAARRVARFSTAAVIDARLDGDPLFIVSEYVPGSNLDEAIRSHGAMTGGTLDSLAMGVAAALTAIHGSGVIHRDLKPANVLLSPVGPKVIDFGIARALDAQGTAVTRSSQLIGTPLYLAPELVLGEEPTPAADIFSWGCLVAFAGLGTAPFDAKTIPAVLHNISTSEPSLEGLDQSLHDLVSTALDKNPANRPTAQQLLGSLVGQNDPQESEVQRTIATSWPPPTSDPVPGIPPPTEGSYDETAPNADPPPSSPPPTEAQPHLGGTQVAPAAHQPTAHDLPATATATPDAEASAPGRGRRWMALAGAVAVMAVLVAAVGAWLSGGDSDGPPDDIVSIYRDDFATDPGWEVGAYDPLDDFDDGYWGGRGLLLRLDPEDQSSRGERPPITQQLPERVVVSASVHAIEGAEQATFGVRCWDNYSSERDERTLYEALLRFDGQRAEIRRLSFVDGGTTLGQSTDVSGFRSYPNYEDGSTRDGDLSDINPSDELVTNTIALACEYVDQDDADPVMRLRMWVNDDLVVDVVDEEPLPQDAEASTESRRVGIATRSGSRSDRQTVLFTDFSVYEILVEE